ncbi:hypothetical protein ACGTNG_10500 [Halomonas sp. 1390]|uniref:hypothetical protein n=1 Tax=Halomonas sp. B23F22_3 TaxID=3459516 RepID=UPI00373F90DA
MTQTVTAAYGSIDKAINAFDELVSEGYPREKLFLDRQTSEVKVIVPETSQPEAEEILNRHGPDDLSSRPYESP